MSGKGLPLVEALADLTDAESAELDRNRAEEEPEMWELAVLEKKMRAECEAQGVPMMPYPADFSDLPGHPRPGAGVPEIIPENMPEIIPDWGYEHFEEALQILVYKFGAEKVKRGVKLWLLEQLDDDAYALVEADDQGRYRDVLDGEILWDPEAD